MVRQLLGWLGGWLSSLGARKTTYPLVGLEEMPGWLGGRGQVASGVTVDETSAMSLSGVFAAVDLLSRVIASLPLAAYRRLAAGGREFASTHPVNFLLGHAPNSDMTAFSFRRTLEFNRLLWGNCYAEIVWSGGGQAKAIWPIAPWRVTPSRTEAGDLVYQVDRGDYVLLADQVLHVPHVSNDGVLGRSFVAYATEALGLGLAAQEFAARFYANGSRPGGLLRNPGNPPSQAREEMRKAWTGQHGGASKSHVVGLLWGGWEYDRDAGAINPTDAQLLETRRFAVEEVARFLGIPPPFLAELSRATFSNIEELGRFFLLYSLLPILTAYEQEIDRKLLSPPSLYAKHTVQALMRGDSAARSAYYRELFNVGVFSINEIRELEEMNPIEGGDGHYYPLNMAEVGVEDVQDEPPPVIMRGAPMPPDDMPPEAPADQARAASAIRLADTFRRLLAIETEALGQAARRAAGFLDRVEAIYKKHRGVMAQQLFPDAAACGMLGLAWSAQAVADNWCQQSHAETLELAGAAVTSEQLEEAMQAKLAQWQSSRPMTAALAVVHLGENDGNK